MKGKGEKSLSNTHTGLAKKRTRMQTRGRQILTGDTHRVANLPEKSAPFGINSISTIKIDVFVVQFTC